MRTRRVSGLLAELVNDGARNERRWATRRVGPKDLDNVQPIPLCDILARAANNVEDRLGASPFGELLQAIDFSISN